MTTIHWKERISADELFDKLKQAIGSRATMNGTIREQHGGTECFEPSIAPDIVCFAEGESDITDVIRIAREFKVPLIPFGAGTSMEGQVAAITGGICLDVSRMNRIIRVNDEDLDAVVEPGVTREQLNEYMRGNGLFFSVDPGGEPTLGGMASTRASGTSAVRYGTMKENVLSLKVALPDGRIIRTGSRARKSSTGYDLTHLFVGSEGTLGVITELTVKLHPIPESITAAVCSFPSLKAAVDTIVSVIQYGIPIGKAELMDDTTMEAFVNYSKLPYAVKPTIFFEFVGSPVSVAEQIEVVKSLPADGGGTDFSWADRPEDRTKLWRARHNTQYALQAIRPGAGIMPTDVCVPISRLAECVMETKKDIQTLPFFVSLNGHAGDGNFHLGMLIDESCETEMQMAHDVNERLVKRALAMEGTCSGEHGIGLGKLQFMSEEHGEALGVMRDIKTLFDPEGIMNPGKLIAWS